MSLSSQRIDKSIISADERHCVNSVSLNFAKDSNGGVEEKL